MGCAVEEVLEAQEAASSYAATSLDAPAAGHDETADMAELLGTEDVRYARVDDRDAITRGWYRSRPSTASTRAPLRSGSLAARDRGADRVLPDACIATAEAPSTT